MGFVIVVLKGYIIFTVLLMFVYILRHFVFSAVRLRESSGVHHHDIIDHDLPFVTVFLPMHNEEKVAAHVLDRLILARYPRDRFEIIPINDHSTDGTEAILNQYAAAHPFIRPLHRAGGRRGKPSALNDALAVARGQVGVVFDADYLPSVELVRDIAVSFHDPEVGAVMGRVMPENAEANLLTRLLNLERAAGYQVDQEARQTMQLIPQFGGTVGGFRLRVVREMGGFDPNILTEDTELTFRLVLGGWKVLYNNRLECYEEVPEDWDVRAGQIRRWARGHTQCFFRYSLAILRARVLPWRTKLDGFFLLGIYLVPAILVLGIFDTLALFYLNEVQLMGGVFIFLLVAGFNMFGNFAPFYQIGTALLIDGYSERIRLLPLAIFNFMFNCMYSAQGTFQAVGDVLTRRQTVWQKTDRYRSSPSS